MSAVVPDGYYVRNFPTDISPQPDIDPDAENFNITEYPANVTYNKSLLKGGVVLPGVEIYDKDKGENDRGNKRYRREIEFFGRANELYYPHDMFDTVRTADGNNHLRVKDGMTTSRYVCGRLDLKPSVTRVSRTISGSNDDSEFQVGGETFFAKPGEAVLVHKNGQNSNRIVFVDASTDNSSGTKNRSALRQTHTGDNNIYYRPFNFSSGTIEAAELNIYVFTL